MIKYLGSLFLFLALAFATAPARAADKPALSDDVIADNVSRKLATDPNVKGAALQVEVKEGVVTLKGAVDSQKRKDKAEKVAKKVKGVTSVNNQLQVVLK